MKATDRKNGRTAGVARRRFLKTIPAAVAAGIAVPTLAQQGEQAAAPRKGDA